MVFNLTQLLKIKFNQSKVEECEFSTSDENFSQEQLQIFNTMSNHVIQFLDLDLQFILSVIKESTKEWSEKTGGQFSYFNSAIPQERVYIAGVMKERIAEILRPLLLNSEDNRLLTLTLDKALKKYIDNFAVR